MEPDILSEGRKIFSLQGYEPNELGGFDNEDEPINAWVRFSLRVMVAHLSKIHKGVVFVSGGLPGTETWASEEVAFAKEKYSDRGIKLLTVLPYPNMSGRKDNGDPLVSRPWPIKSHNRLLKIVESSDALVTVGKGYKSIATRKARDKWVIEQSYGAIFVTDDNNRNEYVSEAMGFAKESGVQCCVIDPTSEKMYIL